MAPDLPSPHPLYFRQFNLSVWGATHKQKGGASEVSGKREVKVTRHQVSR